MLALPLQGYAGAHMLMCSADTGAHARHAAAPPCHGGAQAGLHGADTHLAKHDGAKAGSCAACSLLAPMAIGLPLPPDLDGPVSTAIPFHARRLPSVAPALPDRPPRPVAA